MNTYIYIDNAGIHTYTNITYAYIYIYGDHTRTHNY